MSAFVLPVMGGAQRTNDVIVDILKRVSQGLVSEDDYVRLGDAYLALDELDDAKKAFETAVRLGDKVRGHTGIGRVYSQKKGEGMRAQYHFRRALGEDPSHAEAQYGLAKLYERLRPLDALQAFEKAIDMAPDHGDAYFQLGQLFEHEGDRMRAMVAYEQQIEVASGHGLARYHLGRLLFAQGQHNAAAKIFGGLIATGGEVATKAYLEMALMSEIAQNYDSAQRLFEIYIGRLPEDEQFIFKDISLVADAKVLALFAHASDKKKMIDRFWNSQDPAPLTRANERLVEHYRRVAFALSQYSAGESPWDDRGEVYVRLGHPDHVSRSDNIQIELDPYITQARERFANRLGPGYTPPGGRPLFPIAGRWEYWVYTEIDKGTEFAFENEFGRRYTFADIPLSSDTAELSPLLDLQGELIIRSIAAKTPSLYDADFADLPIDFYYYPAGFRGEGNETRLELYLGLPASEVVRLNTGNDLIVLERGVALYDSLWHEVHRVTDKLTFRTPSNQQIQAGAFIPGVLPVTLAPGKYYMSLQVRDAESGHSQVYQQMIELDDYRRDDVLRMSDIELAFVVAPTRSDGQFVKDGLNVVPMSSKAFRRDQNAYVYFEVYNLKRNEFGQTRYGVEYTVRTYQDRAAPVRILRGLGRLLRLVEDDQQVVIAYEQVGGKVDDRAYVELDLRASDVGEQLIVVKVTDMLTEQEVEKEILFKIVP
ncbi:MAG: GWxTD domain-containing protein [Candidatus Latescibacteria bacterium]|nr:GWxTD domain-containing protein [Candidatus Latescibacterota bacterium]